MAKSLIKYETLDKEQIDSIMQGLEPEPPKDSADSNDNSSIGSDTNISGDDTERIDKDGNIGVCCRAISSWCVISLLWHSQGF